MKTIMIATIAVALTGCAVIPGTESTVLDTRSTEPMLYKSKQESASAAKCVLKNIDEKLGFIDGSVRDGIKANAFEVRGRSAVGMAAIVDIDPEVSGSLITTWVSNHYPAKGVIMRRITNNC